MQSNIELLALVQLFSKSAAL